MKKLWQKIKEQFSNDNISDDWKKVRNTAGVVFTVGSVILAMPVSLPVTIFAWVQWITLASGIIAGRAQINTGKKNEPNRKSDKK